MKDPKEDIKEKLMTASKVVELQEIAHRIAKLKGFWEDDRENATMIALMHSELSEALEADREGNMHGEDSVAEEMADTVIRIMDFCEAKQINLGAVINRKMQENLDREHKHGKNY